MNKSKHVFTSESVTEGHPDKVADQISDAILDAIIKDDPDCHVACETFLSTGLALVGGEITTTTYVDIQKIVRGTIRAIGYTEPELGFDYRTTAVLNCITRQSPDIALGVDRGDKSKQGAGDQGMMFGYACDETPELMPMPIMLAHKLTRRLASVRKEGILPYLNPDGKSQVSIEYEDGRPQEVVGIVVSAQHAPDVTIEQIRTDILEHVIKPIIPQSKWSKDIRIHINPTGRFVIGGPMGDTGMTGRKIIVDTYGGRGSHGGGCFSGKDPSKVDRSASYMARYIAKNIVAAKLARECEVQLSYAIGVAEPIAVTVDTFNTGILSDEELTKMIQEVFPLRPGEIIEYLDLKRPIYRNTAVYGHFGRNEKDFTWEKLDKVNELK